MYKHITYNTQSTVCQGGFSNKFFSSSSWMYAEIAKGGQLFFWGGAKIATRGVAMRLNCAIFEWCNLVRFGAYFHKFLTFKKSKNFIFIQKIIINCSHVLARESRSMVHSPLIIFIKGCNL